MKRFGKKLSALLVTAAMAATMAAPVGAATDAYEPVAGTDQTLNKYLVMDDDVSVPAATFTYTVTAGDAVTGAADTLAVFAGNDANRTNGALPRVENVVFTVASTTSTTSPADFTLPSGKKYASGTIAIDFDAVTYKEPGVYRYILTETSAIDGITNDTDGNGTAKNVNCKRTIDVYVEHKEAGTLEVKDYVVYEGEITTAPTEAGANLAAKSTCYINEYATYDITLSKTVEGNQASRDEYFQFTVNISDANPGTEYPVTLTNADATTSTNGVNTTAQTNPAKITVGDAGTAEATFWLQGGQSIVIKGLATATKYTIAEDAATVITAEGYDISATASGDADVSTANAASEGAVTDTTTGIRADTAIDYTNTKEGTIPTGVLLTMAPVIVVGVVVIAGLAFFAVRNAKRKAYEAADDESDAE